MNLADSTIAVTGATGSLGRNIVEVLLARGARVVGVVRDPGKVPGLADRVELRRADLGDRGALEEALEGCDGLVSNAGMLNIGLQKWSAHERVNVGGIDNLLRAAAATGTRRVVHMSSISVYSFPARKPLDDEPPLMDGLSTRHPLKVYPLSKALGERRAWKLADELGLSLTALRPSGIFGAWDTVFWSKVRALYSLPLAPVPVGWRISWIYAGDVAEAIALSLEKQAAIGRAYNVAGDASTTFWQLLSAWRQAGGRTPLAWLPLPLPMRRYYDTRKLREELGWQPRDPENAMRDMLALEQKR